MTNEHLSELSPELRAAYKSTYDQVKRTCQYLNLEETHAGRIPPKDTLFVTRYEDRVEARLIPEQDNGFHIGAVIDNPECDYYVPDILFIIEPEVTLARHEDPGGHVVYDRVRSEFLSAVELYIQDAVRTPR